MITEAVKKLRPGAMFSVTGETYEGIVWMDESIEKPSKLEVETLAKQLMEERAKQRYIPQRIREYPPVSEYIDAVVKGDQEQLQAYIDACLAVKAKYPKPE